jgi:putative transposase
MAVEVWAWCLMPNHVHLILVPRSAEAIARAVGETHRRYTAFVNARARQTGHLFQSRFSSVVMDEDHLLAAVRYVSLNPVRAGLAARPEAWPWSSVRAHLAGNDDELTRVAPMLDRLPDFASLLDGEAASPADDALRQAETTGRPLGDARFLDRIERRLGRPVRPQKRGPKPKDDGNGQSARR